jgi:hypothetical protein
MVVSDSATLRSCPATKVFQTEKKIQIKILSRMIEKSEHRSLRQVEAIYTRVDGTPDLLFADERMPEAEPNQPNWFPGSFPVDGLQFYIESFACCLDVRLSSILSIRASEDPSECSCQNTWPE